MPTPLASATPTRPRRSFMGLLGMVVLVGMGEHMGERYLPLYLADLTRGATTIFAIGLLAGLDDFLSALYSYPGGWLSDRIGAKRALLAFNLLAMLGYALVIFIPTWWAVLAGAALFISWSAISMPAIMDLVSSWAPKNRRATGISVLAFVRRMPKLLGPVVGGLLITFFGLREGIRLSFAAALGLAALGAILQQTMIQADTPRPKTTGGGLRALNAAMRPELRTLLISDILVRFCERMPDVFVILWATRVIASPVSEAGFGFLSALENLVAMFVYLPVAWWADRGGRKPVVTITFGFFTLFPIVLAGAHSEGLLIAAFIVRGLKEFGEPTRKALIIDYSPPEQRAAMFGFYYLVRDLVVSIAAFGGAWLWAVSPYLNLGVAAACGAAGTAWFALRFPAMSAPPPR